MKSPGAANQPHVSPRLLTVHEVAAILVVPPRRLDAWRADNKGPRYILVGRSVRYRQSDVDHYISENEHGPARD